MDATRKFLPLSLMPLVGLLAGCHPADVQPSPPTYRLTADELAWQGYENGQELRFGRAGSRRVRTMQVLLKQDVLTTQWHPGGWLPIPTADPLYQHVKVTGQRTDSLIYSKSYSGDSARVKDVWLDLYKYEDRGGELYTEAQIGWTGWFHSDLPVALLTTNQFTPSSRFELLASITLGGRTYSQVIKATMDVTSPSPGLVTQVYYAKGLGVVAYQETGTGLWYRLP